MVVRGQYFLIFFLSLVLLKSEAQTIDFTFPSNICAGTPFNFTNNSTGASTYKWNFCSKDLNQPPAVQNLGGFGMLDQPTYIDIVFTNNNYYGFVTNFSSGDLIRLDFGNSLLNNPVAVNLGDINNVIPSGGNGGIRVVQNEGKWYGIIVAGYPPGGVNPRILKIEFGTNITNLNPSGVNWGNLGNMYDPNDLILVKEGNEWIGMTVNGESNSLIITNDTTICAGSPLQINTHPAVSYLWSPSTFLDDPTAAMPVTTTTQNIKYYVDALVAGDNLVKNGDFSNGNSDFLSGYTYTPTNVSEGEYFVGNDPKTWNISLDYCSDHTNGNGQMLLVNGSPTAGKQVWSQAVTIKPNTDYAFSTWLQAVWAPNPADLQFYINGIPLGGTFSATVPPCNWAQFYSIWNSGGNTTVTLSIVNMNTSIVGNDFAIDDISFSELIPVKDSISINVKQPYIKANNDTIVCAGSPVQLNVAQGAFFTWSPATGLSNSGIPNPVATPATTTEYVVIGIDPGGCLAKDSVVITVKPSPVVNITSDTTICKGAIVQLSANGGGTYQWSPAANLNNTSIFNPITSATTDITYKVKVTGSNACTSEDSVKIGVRQYPLFSASSINTVVCAGDSTTISASGGDTYMWSPAASFPDPALPSISFVPAASETYIVTINDNVCHHDTVMNVSINVNPLPIVTAQKSNDINCTTPVATLQASGAKSYNWSPAESLSDGAIAKPVATPETTTTYEVTGASEFGCTSSASVLVNVTKTGVPRFVVPNAFTPNNDGKNDCFGIQHWGDAVIKQFSIYNRWGALIFQSADPSQCWDGTWKGKPQDGGGYVYIINATTLCGDVTKKGMLTLIR